jgi:oligopeptidase A
MRELLRCARKRRAARLRQLCRSVAGAEDGRIARPGDGLPARPGAARPPHAERDLAELRAFAAERAGPADLQAWDRAFASEKLKEQRYAFSEQEVKQYFTEPKVLEGLFHMIETLFDVRIRARHAPVWHPACASTASSGAADARRSWSASSTSTPTPARQAPRRLDGRRAWPLAAPDGQGLQTPVAHLVCNFAAPVGGKPALLTHDDVITLFHEFGHGLHHMLTRWTSWRGRHLRRRVGRGRAAQPVHGELLLGMGGAAALTAHVDTGAPLPRALFDRMLAAKNFQSGLQTLRQIEFALFDMRLHAEPMRGRPRVQAVRRRGAAEVAVNPPPPFNRFQHTFSHIFAGGYAAGYYSYKWAEVLSADALPPSRRQGVFDPATGQRFRREILEAGGSRPAMDSFRGLPQGPRDPDRRRCCATRADGQVSRRPRPRPSARTPRPAPVPCRPGRRPAASRCC